MHSANFNGKHADFERQVLIDIEGRYVKDLLIAFEKLSDEVEHIYLAQLNDVHIYNHDVNGAHLSLDYSLDKESIKNEQPSEVTLTNTALKGSDEVCLRIWRFDNVVSPADAATALDIVSESLREFSQEYFLDLTSSCALLEESVFSLELRLYTAKLSSL